MAVRNNHWYNSNESRDYPLDESASLLSDQGERLPAGIIADLNLRYPEILGDYPFLASVGVTTGLVSVTIQAAVSLTGDPGLNPVAVFSIATSELVEGRPYALEPQIPGVGGWIVFGSGTQEPFTGRFSGPSQSLLTARAARQYRSFPVGSLGRLGTVESLEGVVQLKGVDPIQIVKETRDIDGVDRDVIVIRLIQTTNVTEDGQEVNVFSQFAGDCGKRPETETCGAPSPIEFINTVGPDCDGNLTIELRGCADIAKVIDQCGVVVDCEFGLIDACLDNRLPDDDGTLPNEYPDLCFPVSESLEEEVSESPDPIVPAASESPIVVGELPFIECFVPGNISAGWMTESGLFSFILGNSPAMSVSCESDVGESYASLDTTERNLAVWDGFDDSTINRKVTTDFKLTAGSTGAEHNAGIVLNYRPDLALLGAFEYFLVQADWDRQVFEVLRFNGTTMVPTSAFAFLPGLKLDAWYRITAEITPAGGSSVSIRTTLDSIEDSSLSVVLGPFTTSQYLPDTGLMGVHAASALSRFSWFEIAELP